ncbi:uncharacterized protein LOC134535324 [Bacillus rossius redtenbacheri]|uniref:uncharacterized protein LOC134535324 n=1 Tax=Bacillus rossius redtenbacheri TaxID=93214 RepID=UPI002FDCC876
MTSWTMWVLLAVVCTATLLDAMAVSERERRSAEENKESPAAAVAENTDENKPVNGTDDATQPRARRDAGAGTPADAPGSPDQQRRLETTPEHQRVARQASDENSRDTKKGSDEKEQDKKEGEESKKNGTETEKKSDGKQ